MKARVRAQVVGMALAGADLAAIAAAVGETVEACGEVLRANGVRARAVTGGVAPKGPKDAPRPVPVAPVPTDRQDNERARPAAQVKPGWSDAEIAELRRLWDLGLSFSEIAKALPGRSRNATVAKADRLGLDRLAESPIKRRAAPVAVPVLPAAAPAPRLCQWIDGLPSADDACKCGEPADPGRPYCAPHAARAYAGRAGPVDPKVREGRARRVGRGPLLAELLSNGGMR